jgi:hypothetical protein
MVRFLNGLTGAANFLLTVSLRYDYFAGKGNFHRLSEFSELHSETTMAGANVLFTQHNHFARRLLVTRYLDNKDLESLYLNSERAYEARQGEI